MAQIILAHARHGVVEYRGRCRVSAAEGQQTLPDRGGQLAGNFLEKEEASQRVVDFSPSSTEYQRMRVGRMLVELCLPASSTH